MMKLFLLVIVAALGISSATAQLAALHAGPGAPSGAMVNPIMGGPIILPVSGSAAQSVRFSSGDAFQTNNAGAPSTNDQPQAIPGTISGLNFTLTNAAGTATPPTSGTPITATLFKNGATTSWGCTITNPATACTCPQTGTCGGTAPPTVVAGDTLAFSITASTWTATQLYGSIGVLKTNAAGAAEWFSATGSINLVTTTQFFNPNGDQNAGSDLIASAVMPAAGTITGYTVKWGATPTASIFITAQLCYNGVCSNPCAGWNGSAAVNPCTVTFSQPFVAKDTVSMQFVPTGSNNTIQRTAISYVPTTPNQAILALHSNTMNSATNHYSMTLRGFSTPIISSGNVGETWTAIPNFSGSMSIKNLMAYQTTVQSGGTRTYALAAGASIGATPAVTALTCVASGSSTTLGDGVARFGCQDTTDVISATANTWGAIDSIATSATASGTTKISTTATVSP